MLDNDQNECEVDGAMLFLLRTMRWFGVAPVRIQKYDSKHYIKLYRTYMYLGIIFIACITTVTLIGFIQDVTKSSPSTLIIQILDVSCTLIIPCLGTYGAWNRILRATDYLKSLKKILQNNNESKMKKDEKYKTVFIKCNLLLLSCGVCLHFYISIMNTENRTELIMLCLFSTVYVSYFIIFLLGNWYKLIVQLINTSLNAINSEIMDIIKDLEHDSNNVTKRKSKPRQAPLNLPFNSINKVIDNLAVVQFERPASAFSKRNEMKIHRLLLQNIRVYDIIATFNSCEGSLLLFLLTAYVINFTNITYDLISTIRYVANIPMSRLYFINHCIWCTFIVNNMVAIVDPCQRTAVEVDKIKGLVSRLMSYVTSDLDPVKDDLEIYFNQLMLYNSNYSPMGVVTLNRSLILTVFGGVVTCVLILVDFNIHSGFIDV